MRRIRTRPLVSVIIPTYNRASLLREALDSVFAQEGLGARFTVEVIVVDDASTEPVAHIVRSYPNVNFRRLASNQGVSAARNEGVQMSHGKYVAFLDDDDIWLPHHLKTQIPVVEAHYEVGVVYSQARHMGKVQPDARHARSGRIFNDLLLDLSMMHTSTVLIRREVLQRVGGFDETMLIGEDADMWLRLAFHTDFRFVPGVVSLVRQTSGAIGAGGMVSGQLERAGSRVIEKAASMLPETAGSLQLKRRAIARFELYVAQHQAWMEKFEDMQRSVEKCLQGCPDVIEDPDARMAIGQIAGALAKRARAPRPAVHAFCARVTSAAGRQWRSRPAMRRFVSDVFAGASIGLGAGKRARSVDAGAAALAAIGLDPAKARRKALLWFILRAMVRSPRKTIAERRAWSKDDGVPLVGVKPA